jgi:hypothetical protein
MKYEVYPFGLSRSGDRHVVAQSKNTRRLTAEIAGDEEERLQTILYQALDEWLRAHVVNLLKNISAQSSDPKAVDRALNGARYGIKGWKVGRAMVHDLAVKTDYDERS